ncbi:MAG: hypothetical protein E6G56_02205 [Actinobacteria bacterium]|nr:MAG: hypothetical protein E6G56_02205 [Actinomycetota bacterium]
MSSEAHPRPVSRRRLVTYYAVLAVLGAGATGIVVAEGVGKHAPRPVAGGYDVLKGAACLGTKVEVNQSGRFIDLSGEPGSARAKLELHGTRMSGSVHCAGGGARRLDATWSAQRFVGTVGGQPLTLALKRDPPPPASAKPRPPSSIAGDWRVAPTSTCLGGRVAFSGGHTVAIRAPGTSVAGTLRYQPKLGSLAGQVRCRGGGSAELTGSALDRMLTLSVAPASRQPSTAPGRPPGQAARAGPAAPAREQLTATKVRDPSNAVAAFFIAVVVVMLAARLVGEVAVRIGQPRVMGEVLAGILLGPTVLGAISADAQSALFPSDIVPVLGIAANLGLIFYMFLVGLELDPRQLRVRLPQTFAISNTGVLVPMAAGLLVALPTYGLLAPDKPFLAFALFMGVSMSITAFPVLARIIVERRMLSGPVGALALAAAAVDDVTAWLFIALAAAVAAAGSALHVMRTVLLAIAFSAVMALGVRRILARASVAFDEAGRVPGAWITAIFAGVLISAYLTEQIGIAVIFGAFVMGAVMPRHAGLTEDVTRRVEDFVAIILLPLFFAYTGLRTNVGLLDRPALWLLTLVLIVVAVLCKFGGSLLAARVMGVPWRESAVIGALMNTRGLTELIVLNLALEKGVMSEALFSALVVMALVTTFMTGPLLRLLDPHNRFGSPVEEELDRARSVSRRESRLPVPDRSILVAPGSDAALAQLLDLAEPLARSEPPRELIMARLIEPPRSAEVRGGLQTESRALGQAVELRGTEPLALGTDSPLVVPFGGAEHDWAALELGAWLAAANAAPLRLLGAAGQSEESRGRDASRLLANASLLVQRFAGVAAEPVIAEPGREGVVAAAQASGLLVIGLSDRWRSEGLGPTRSEVVQAAPAPILFVRRGQRPGALAPREDVTRFTWSTPAIGRPAPG